MSDFLASRQLDRWEWLDCARWTRSRLVDLAPHEQEEFRSITCLIDEVLDQLEVYLAQNPKYDFDRMLLPDSVQGGDRVYFKLRWG